ncbi:hypothetical protein ACTXKI_11975 [Psychrobacter celer]|uniref:hypothetical protein n=1 Tax=Psychrobacter celer TaxID=306572 RepID=UPI003FD39509
MTSPSMTAAPQAMPKKWYFVTNHQNLLMYLMLNIITPLASLGKKSYQDSLSFKVGYTPVFSTKPPKWAHDMSIKERDDLLPVIIELDLNGYQGQLLARRQSQLKPQLESQENSANNQNVDNQGWQSMTAAQVFTTNSYDCADLDLTMLLLSEPIAAGVITAIKFANKESIKKIKDKVLDTNGVDISLYQLTTQAALFKFNKNHAATPPSTITIDNDGTVINYSFANAITAVYASLNLFANVNEQALNALLTLLQKNTTDINLPLIDDILNDFCQWIITPNSEAHSKAGRLYIDMIEIIIGSSNLSQAKKSIIELLQSQIDPANAQVESQQFVDDLSSMLGLKDKSFNELMTSYTKSFHRMLLTFFHTDGIERFLESDSLELSDSESALAMIMIAASTGWAKLPITQKNYAGMHKDISLLLAQLCASQLNNRQSVLANVPLPVRYYLKQSWNKKSRDAAKVLITDNNWTCLDYEISLPHGQYDINTTAKFVKFKSNHPIRVEEMIDQNEFLTLMTGLNYIDSKVEQLMRSALGI